MTVDNTTLLVVTPGGACPTCDCWGSPHRAPAHADDAVPVSVAALARALREVSPPDPEWAEEAAGSVNMSVDWRGWAERILDVITEGERLAPALAAALTDQERSR